MRNYITLCLLMSCCGITLQFAIPENYDSSTRPNNGGVADVINLSMSIVSIREVNEEQHKFSVEFILQTFWKDGRLANLVERETVFGNKLPDIWTPELTIANLAEVQLPSRKAISLKPDGTLGLSERISATINCPISMIRYPFGRQNCKLQLSTNGYTTVHLTLLWNGMINDDNVSLFDPEYSLRAIEQLSETKRSSSGEYSYLTVVISLARNPFRLIARALIPTFVFAVLSYFVTFFMNGKFIKSRGKFGSNKKLEETSEESPNPPEKGSETEDKVFSPQTNLCLPYMFLDIVKVVGNAFVLLTLVLIRQINFIKIPKSDSPTALDLWTGFMSLHVFLCFLLSLQMCYMKWRQIVGQISENEDEGDVSSKVVNALKISIPFVFILFLIAYLGFCLS